MDRDVFCRSCLVTDVELCSMNKLNLLEPYETLTGIKVMQSKDLSVFMCGCCKTLLLKCIWFVNKCKKAEEVLEIAEKQYDITVRAKFIKTIDRAGLQLGLALTSSPQEQIDLPANIVIKEELQIDNYTNQDVFLSEETQESKNEIHKQSSDLSDEEVLSDLAKKKSLKKVTTVKKKVEKRKRVKKTVVKKNVAVKKEAAVKKEVSVNDDSDDYWAVDSKTTTADNDPELLKKYDTTFKILTKDEALKEMQSRKQSSNYIHSQHKCDKCFKGFQTEATLTNHLVRHDPKTGNLECDICFQRYSKKLKLRYHINETHLYKFICNQCGTTSKTSWRARQHYKWHSGFTYNCKICGSSFGKLTTYLTHLRTSHPSGKFKCERCDIFFVSNKGLYLHNKLRHTSNSPVLPSCDKCNVKFRNENALKLHQENMKNGVCDSSLKPCSLCGVSLISDEDLSKHIKENHPKSKCFKCPICKKMLRTRKTLDRHYDTNHLNKRADRDSKPAIKRGDPDSPPATKPGVWDSEPVFNRVFRSSVPAGPGTVICEVCGKICSSKYVFTCHQRLHTGERPFKCSKCPKKFCYVQNLENHIRTHTGERPFKCDQCDKTFKSKSCVINHSRNHICAHTGERPFKCDQCDKTFKCKAYVIRHSRVHTGAKPFACPHCDKTFTQTNSVKLHINTVHFSMPQPYKNKRKHKT